MYQGHETGKKLPQRPVAQDGDLLSNLTARPGFRTSFSRLKRDEWPRQFDAPFAPLPPGIPAKVTTLSAPFADSADTPKK